MTTPSPRPSAGIGIPLRPLTAWALLALAGVLIVFAFLAWIIPPDPGNILGRFDTGRFTDLAILVGPLLAVLISSAAVFGPPLAQARLIGLIALVEYTVAVLLGTLAFLITLATHFDGLGGGIYAVGGALQALGGILADALRLVLLALAGLWTYQLFTRLGGKLPRLNVKLT